MFTEIKYLNIVSPQLRNFKKKSNELWNFSCPYCGDSQKSKTKARGFVFRKESNLIYKCHNCGVGASFKNFLKNLDLKIYNEYIMERYKDNDSDEPVVPQTRQPKVIKRDQVVKSLKKISSLEHNHPVKKYILSRQIPSKVHYELFYTPKFYKWVNSIVPNKFPELKGDHPRLVIPFFDEKGKMFAFQGRAFGDEKPKYITIVLDNDKQKIYGLNRVNWNRTVYVTEGPIDSLFVDNCVATAQSDLRIGKKDNVVLVPDNEPRNFEIVKQIEKFIDDGYSVVLWPESIKQKDVNEMILAGMSESEIKKIIINNTYTGLQAKAQFMFWKKVEIKNEKRVSRN